MDNAMVLIFRSQNVIKKWELERAERTRVGGWEVESERM